MHDETTTLALTMRLYNLSTVNICNELITQLNNKRSDLVAWLDKYTWNGKPYKVDRYDWDLCHDNIKTIEKTIDDLKKLVDSKNDN